jgi:hypothetical protein
MKISLQKLEALRSSRGEYVAALEAAGRRTGEWLLIDESALRAVLARHRPERLADLTSPAFVVTAAGRPDSELGSTGARGSEPPLPPLFRRAANAAAAVSRVAGAMIHGKPVLVSQTEQNRRWVICSSPCDHFRPSDAHCAACGCPLKGQIRSKIILSTESCPLGKW